MASSTSRCGTRPPWGWGKELTGQVQEKLRTGDLKGKLTNGAHSFRDNKEARELVWRMACLWVHTRPRTRELYSPESAGVHGVAASLADGVPLESVEFQAKQREFREGRLDPYLLERCRALDAGLDLEDLRHIRERRHQLMNNWTPDALASKLDQVKLGLLEAEYQLIKTEVAQEESSWAGYLLNLQLQQDVSQSAITKAREEAEDRQAKLIAEHVSTYYPACVLPDHNFHAAIQSASLAVCEGQPRYAPEALLRLNVINLAAMGCWHSLRLASLVSLVSMELAEHPKTTAVLVILPNTPVYGSNVQPGKHQAEFDRLVEEAKLESLGSFRNIPETRSKTITGQWAVESMCPSVAALAAWGP